MKYSQVMLRVLLERGYVYEAGANFVLRHIKNRYNGGHSIAPKSTSANAASASP